MPDVNKDKVERIKANYPEGTRIKLIHTGRDLNPVPDNTLGTVRCVDDAGTIHCIFDNGRCLGIIPDEDDFCKI